MTRIADLLDAGRTYSFEFFPPKNEAGRAQLESTLSDLQALRPSFVSITYGAGGSTRRRTHDMILHILRDTSMLPMAHLSCVSHEAAELRDILMTYHDEGVENILALAGDPPEDGTAAELTYASELVQLIRSVGDFSIGVAAHPKGHPRSTSLVDDRKWLAHKLAMADFAITQFFFEVRDYLDLVETLAAMGVERPVLPGIMPITNVAQVERFAVLSGAPIPDWLLERLHAQDTPEDVRKVGVEVATDLCRELLEEDAPGLHFYTLNNSTATREIYGNLGVLP